jgi:tetratricopeptide (TPR) repeat protein
MAGGGGGPPAAAAALKDQGNEQFKSGNYLKAAALYTQAIKLDPDNATLYRFGSVLLLLSHIGTLAPDLGPSQ